MKRKNVELFIVCLMLVLWKEKVLEKINGKQ